MLQDRQGLEKHFQLLATYSLAPFYPGDIPPPCTAPRPQSQSNLTYSLAPFYPGDIPPPCTAPSQTSQSNLTYSLAPFYPGDIPPPLYRAQSIIPVKYHRAQTIHHPSQI